MTKLPYALLEKGSLLVASPEVNGGVFSRSVVLICEHSPNGSFGLILNKTLEIESPEEIFPMDYFDESRVRFCMGGPLQANQIMLLHTGSESTNPSIEICPSVFLGGDFSFIQEKEERAHDEKVLLCFGYSGWQGGQLEKEFLEGLWFLAPASQELVFTVHPENLWSFVLQNLGGRFASLSTVPENLLLN
ncbi:YqgE/AlgH family protein [Chlamydia sp.]|uniref:YqgE/AlgH family protein n=1 Tax=Chlamydia sp. TaxID=35827 RepID=UPI0025C2CC93|nr:YqgE/AlgH family protein [Chlamydia sp.]MBQ8498352.1 YqgE/AlgH family protein [Chlamydia sp.]